VDRPRPEKRGTQMMSLFAWLISHQPTVFFSRNKPATSNQPAVLFSQKRPAPAISHQPTEQAGWINPGLVGPVRFWRARPACQEAREASASASAAAAAGLRPVPAGLRRLRHVDACRWSRPRQFASSVSREARRAACAARRGFLPRLFS
jgi:hypothetical protein